MIDAFQQVVRLVIVGVPQHRVGRPSAKLSGITAGTVVSVKAINGKGMEGWDWARIVVQ